MYEIIVLSSFHMINGKLNPNELYKIIEKIQPDVIFEELPSHVFDVIYSEGNKPKTIEAITIKEYLKTHQVTHIPVDTYEKNYSSLFKGFDIIAEKNNEYIKLLNEQLTMIGKYGYSFLNSATFDELMDKMQNIEENVLSEINDERLSKQYRGEKNLHINREKEMIKNIYNYSKLNQYNRALFICGAEHKKSIIKVISNREENEELKLNWKFYKSENF